jgi:hypothetical protein
MVRHCSWGQCTSDTRKKEPAVTFVAFPKPEVCPERARRWAFLCGRAEAFTLANITRYSVVCSKHFGPGAVLDAKRSLSLEPFNALWSEDRLQKALRPQRREGNVSEDADQDQGARQQELQERRQPIAREPAQDPDVGGVSSNRPPPTATYPASRRHRSSASFLPPTPFPTNFPPDLGTYVM